MVNVKRNVIKVSFSLLFCLLLGIAVSGTTVNAASKIKKVTISSIDNVDTTTQKIKWQKVKNISGYQIYYKVSGSKYKKLATVGKGKKTYTVKGLLSNKKYFYKIRAYKRAKRKTRYGKYSAQMGKKTTDLLLDLYDPYYQDDASVKLAPDSISMGGDTYYNAITFAFHGSAIFNLKGKYRKISFIAGPLEDGNGPIFVFADDVCVWNYTIEQGALPKVVTVDIENASKLEFKIQGNHIARASHALANIRLYK